MDEYPFAPDGSADLIAFAILYEAMARVHSAAAAFITEQLCLPRFLRQLLNEEQLRHFAAHADRPAVIAACFTEPDTGSDTAGIATTAQRQPDGSWVINGRKTWISRGTRAELAIIYARIVEPEPELKAEPGPEPKAEDDEPLFVLRANDSLAPQIVRQWAAAYRIAKGDAIEVGHREPLKIEGAGTSGGRGERRLEARAFLVAERKHVNAERHPPASAREVVDRENPGNHAERSVVHAGVDHGVDVRADEQTTRLRIGAFPLVRGAPASAHGAERVLGDAKARLAHPGYDQIGGAAVLGRKKQAHEPVGLGGDAREFVDHRLGAQPQSFGVDGGHRESGSEIRPF